MFLREGAGAREEGGGDEFIARSLVVLVCGRLRLGGWIGSTCALEADRLPPNWVGECSNASSTYPRTSNHAGILIAARMARYNPQAVRLFRAPKNVWDLADK